MITVREISSPSVDKFMNNPRHGGPYDRGSADAYYGRPFNPHYFKGKTHQSEMVCLDDMKPDEILEYAKGYAECTDRKDYGDRY